MDPRFSRHCFHFPAPHFFCFLVLLACVAVSAAPGADGLRILGPGAPDEPPAFRVISSGPGGLEIEFAVPTVHSQEVTVDGRTYQVLAIPGGDEKGSTGEPMIPAFTRLVMVPDRAAVQVTATVEDEEELGGFHLWPVQSEDAPGFSLNAAAYARDSFGDEAVAQEGAPAIMRGLRLVSVTLSPVSYNPAQGKVRIARRVRLNVRFDGEDSRNATAGVPRSIAPSFDRIYRHLVINYPGDESRAPVQNGSYLVICPNDAQVTAHLQPLLDWRRREGYTVRLATTAETGTTADQIKAYIQNAYNTWSPPPEFVVLAGDASAPYNIPTFYYDGGEGDFAYTQLDGDDLIGDVHIGRLSFGTLAELDVIVAKTVNYESTPYVSDPAWFNRACLVGDPNQSGISTVQVMQWVKTRLRQIGYTQIDTIFNGNFVSQMSTALNRGDSIFAYRGYYGFSGWSNSNTYALTNYNKLEFAVISTCGTGSFAGGTSNSEAFLRAGTVALPKAAVGATGTATLSTHTRYNNCFEMGLFQGLLYEDLWEMGAAATRGRYELYLNYGTADLTRATEFCTWNNLMGDPACRIFTATPTALNVTYPATVALGDNSVIVTVNEQAGGACAEAQVCLWKGNETFVVGQTDAGGRCELPVNLLTAGAMKLTITKHNRVPLLADITVAAQNVFVGYQASSIDDSNSAGGSGNGDGQINPGETIHLPVQLKNFGFQIAPDVSAVLTSSDPYVTLVNSGDTFGNINAGASVWGSGGFLFNVSPATPQAHVLRLGLEVTSGSNTWHSLINLTAVAPHLIYADSTLYDAGGNNLLDPGETVGLSVTLENLGVQAAAAVTGTLSSLSPWVTVTDASGSFGDIPVGGSAGNSEDRFAISASLYVYRGHLALFRLVTSCNGGAADTTIFAVKVGQAAGTDPVGPDHYGYYALDDTDADYTDAPVYNWIELDPAYGGSGTEIVLGDNGDGQDKSRTVDLPFMFQFYGNHFYRTTVCSNGWMAMGDTYLTDYRNWTIPGAGAPNSLLAVFWDELYQSPASKAYQQYDADNHRWVVEWSRFVNAAGGVPETFEAILYDPAFYPSPSGDGQIVFQYNTVNNLDSTDGYATVGIQNFDHTDGLLYTYFNLYPTAAAPLSAGRAIRFIVGAASSAGILQGTVLNGSNGGTPIPGAHVTMLQNGHSLTTGPDGSFGGTAAAGSYTIVAAHDGFRPDTLRNIAVIEGQTTTIGFSLTDIGGPQISDLQFTESVNQPTDPIPVGATITDLSALEVKDLFWRANGGPFSPVPMALQNGDVYQGLIPAQPLGTQVEFYLHATDIVGNSSLSPADAPNTLYSIFVVQSFFADDFETDHGWIPFQSGDTQSGRWARWDPIGTQYLGVQCEPANDHTPDPGHQCFDTGVGQTDGAAEDSDVDNGSVTLTSPAIDLSGASSAFVSYWRWWARVGTNAGFFVAQVSSNNGATWTSLEYAGATASTWTRQSFNLNGLIAFTSQVRFRFLATAVGAEGIVEVAIDDFSVDGIPDISSAAPSAVFPAETALYPNQPNPFCRETTLRFRLAREETASLCIYDPTGRLVRTLRKGRFPAGEHSVIWDGRDDTGRPVGTGIYFCEMRASGESRPYRKAGRLLMIGG